MGWFTKTRWQRSRGVDFPIDEGVPSAETIRESFAQLCDFDNGLTDNPEGGADVGKYSSANIANSLVGKSMANRASIPAGNRKFLPKILSLIGKEGPPGDYTYTERDSILYNLGLGAKRTDLPLVYENDDSFAVLPTFGVLTPYHSPPAYAFPDIIPNFNPRMGVHAEQYFEVLKYPVPTHGTLVTRQSLIEVVDKSKAALIRRGSTTVDKITGEPICYGESVMFVRNSGNFGGPNAVADRGAATAPNKPPGRAPDKVVVEKTSNEQAAIYRLMGDRNPLHIDPAFSKIGGFPVPILHGLCTMGISAKHVLQTYGPYKNIKVRFSGPVLPGQTLRTEMWLERKNKVIFETKVVETGKLAISAAAAELIEGTKALL
jgi:multifunctional beta-oxidation protein